MKARFSSFLNKGHKIPFTTGCNGSIEERDRCFWLGLGAFTGFFFLGGGGALLLLVWVSYWRWARSNDGVPLEMAFGGFGFGRG